MKITRYRIRQEKSKNGSVYFLEKVETSFPYLVRYVTLLGAYDNIQEAEKDGLEMKVEEEPPSKIYKYL